MDDHRAVTIRFAYSTPFWPLSLSYGTFYDSRVRRWFISPDHFIGYHMLAREVDQKRVLEAPSGYLARQILQRTIETESSYPGDPVISERWETRREDLHLYGTRLKIQQNLCIRDMLMSTNARPIVDETRLVDTYFCNAMGEGANMNGRTLERVRTEIQTQLATETDAPHARFTTEKSS